jgi:hypothetical protein
MSNPIVIELLEAYLEAAREGHFDSVAIAMTGYPNIAALDYAGDLRLEPATKDAIEILTGKIERSISGWALPPRDESLDASHVVYDLGRAPIGFDFVVWLINAELQRRLANAPAPLKVAFWTGRDVGNDGDARLSARGRDQWIDNMFRPALALICAVEDKRALQGHCPQTYVTRPLVEAARQGIEIPRLRSRITTTNDTRYITITLREAEHVPERNSKLGAWVSFAKYLQRRGDRVIFIRDFAKADERLSGFDTNPFASREIIARMAVYEHAAANLFVSNGPGVLCVFGSRPWLQFVRDADGAPEFWRDKIGLSPGDQYPWSAPNQRVIWAPDTYENIVSAWHQHIGSIVPAAA